MKRKTAQQIRRTTPATEKWVAKALAILGQPALDDENNRYAYSLRQFELCFPSVAAFAIPLFARTPMSPWWLNGFVCVVEREEKKP